MPPRRRGIRAEAIKVEDAFRVLGEGLLQQVREPNIYAYKPHPKQLVFHQSHAKVRLFLGGNRSGKTQASVVEDIWYLTNTHPYKKTPEGKIRGRVVAVDILQGVNQIILPKVSQLLPPSQLINGSWEDSYNKSERQLTLVNGSTCEFLSYEMDLEKFAGTSRHFIHFDEEPPKSIYNECGARVIDTDGDMWISETPVEGMTWVYEDLYEPWQNGDKPASELFVVEVDMAENPYLSEAAITRFLSGLEDDERAAREHGHFVQMSGFVFKSFKPETHVIDPVAPKELLQKGWEIYNSIDHGWNNPTAVLWHAVSPQDQVITFGEHYVSEMTIEEHAKVIHAKEAEWGLTGKLHLRTGDPAMEQHSGITGTSIKEEYAKHGIYIYTDSVPRGAAGVQIGIARMQQYFKLKDDKPAWQITEDCANFIKELRKLRWKTYASKKARDENNRQEQVHKKDDHAFDSARYFSTFLPELAPAPLPDAFTPEDPYLRYDRALAEDLERARAKSDEIKWTVLENF